MSADKEQRERLTGEERRNRIIDAALDLFAEKGFNGARTKEIARLAGISESLIFQHFKTKEDIYHSALQHLFNPYTMSRSQIKEKMTQRDDQGVFSTFAMNVIKANQEDPRILRLAIYNVLESGHWHEDIDQLTYPEEDKPVRELLKNYIQQRIDEGKYREADAGIAARWFMQAVYMYVLDQGASISGLHLECSDEEAIETFVGIFLNGIRNTQEQ